MSSLSTTSITHVFNGDIAADDKVSAAELDTQLGNLAAKQNATKAVLDVITDASNNIAPGSIGLPQLKPEVRVHLNELPIDGLATSGIVGTLTITKPGVTARTLTVQDADGTAAILEGAQVWNEHQTFEDGIAVTGGTVVLPALAIADAALSANVPLKNAVHTWTALQTFTAGLAVTSGTTAVQALTCTTLTASGLTSGRIPLAGAGGLLGDASTLTYVSGVLSVNSSGAVIGGANRLSSETLRVAGGTAYAGTTGTDITFGGGSIWAGGVVGFSSAAVKSQFVFNRTGTNYMGFGPHDATANSANMRLMECQADGTFLVNYGNLYLGKLYTSDTSSTSIQTAGGATLGGALLSSAASSNACSVTTTGAGAVQAYLALVNNGGNGLYLSTQGTGQTGSIFGTVRANYSEVLTSGALAGLKIGNNNNSLPIIFGGGVVEFARFTGNTLASDSLAVKYTTPSTSTTTGALTVAGGLGVVGAVNSGLAVTVPAGGIFGVQGAASGTYGLMGVNGSGSTTHTAVVANTNYNLARVGLGGWNGTTYDESVVVDVGSASATYKSTFFNGNVRLAAGTAIFNSSLQVLGPRGAAVADATDAATAITQLNALLARCRAHGFIA